MIPLTNEADKCSSWQTASLWHRWLEAQSLASHANQEQKRETDMLDVACLTPVILKNPLFYVYLQSRVYIFDIFFLSLFNMLGVLTFYPPLLPQSKTTDFCGKISILRKQE